MNRLSDNGWSLGDSRLSFWAAKLRNGGEGAWKGGACLCRALALAAQGTDARRLLDGARAYEQLGRRVPDRDLLADGVRALQSLDKLDPDRLNALALLCEEELRRRWQEIIKADDCGPREGSVDTPRA